MTGAISKKRPGRRELIFLSKPIFSNNLQAILESIQEPKEQREEIVFDGEKVLLVEDNELNQEIAVTLLKMRNLEIDIAKTGGKR